MKKKILVSIVLPTYNGAQYLRESVESVLAQTFQDWELIIVNDCSTDETPQIADEYASRDMRIKVIHNAVNKRLPESLNVGFREAKGRYLTWTSDDNRFLPTAIDEMQSYLNIRDEVAMVSAGMEYIDADGNVTGMAPYYDDYLIWAKDLVGACFMYRREALAVVGEYDSDKVYVEDYDYWLRIRSKMGKIECLQKKLYQYRRHGGSLTATKENEIRMQRSGLRLEYEKQIFGSYAEDKNILCEIYYDFLLAGHPATWFLRKIYDLLPELHKECYDFKINKSFFVFGAGDFGERAFKILGNYCAGFIDNDIKKIGTRKNGLEIISISEFKKLKNNDYEILVAIGIEHIFEVIKQLQDAGYDKYYTYQRLCNYNSTLQLF